MQMDKRSEFWDEFYRIAFLAMVPIAVFLTLPGALFVFIFQGVVGCKDARYTVWNFVVPAVAISTYLLARFKWRSAALVILLLWSVFLNCVYTTTSLKAGTFDGVWGRSKVGRSHVPHIRAR
jgi:hypothetical protein